MRPIRGVASYALGRAGASVGQRPRAAATSWRAVASVAALLKRDARIRRVQVGAHTDNTGDEGALRALSLQQAQAVKAALVSRGVAADRITVQGFGPDKPIAPNVSARGRARNRRVELDVLEMAP